MRIRTWTITLVFTLSVLFGGVRVTAQPPQPGEAPAPDATPVETLLNPDGTLRLDGSFSGALDASGWQVSLDPERGPIFQPQAGAPRWTNLGSVPNRALTNPVRALAVSGSDLYVGGDFQNAAGIPEADYVAAYATPPSVSAITRLDPNPASAASVQFQVAFDEPVVGVAASDFTLTTTGGISGAGVTGVSGSGATYTVTVATGTGDGTLRLDVPAGATIADLAGLNVSNLPFTSGEAYTVNRGGGSPTPTPPGGGAQVRVYLPLAQR